MQKWQKKNRIGSLRPLLRSGGKEQNVSVLARDAHFWEDLEKYNQTPAKERAEALVCLGISGMSDRNPAILKKSFRILERPVSNARCAANAAAMPARWRTSPYEPCLFLFGPEPLHKNTIQIISVCRWFPFHVYHDPRFGDLLTIKPYCTGYGKGPLVDYDARVREINELASAMRTNEDGAWVIDEVLYLPDRGEWTFPSRANLDRLMKFLAGTEKAGANTGRWHRSAELDHAQHYASGLLGSINDPQLTVSEDGRITDLNEAMEALCRKKRALLMESRLDAIFVNPVELDKPSRCALPEERYRVRLIDWPCPRERPSPCL